VPSEDHPAAGEVWADVKAALRQLTLGVSEERKLVSLAGGGSVQLWSGYDPDGLRGTYFDGVVVDECSLQREGVWTALRPTLSDYGGWGLLLGTVPEDVQEHWFVHLHRYAESEVGRARGWETWRLPSWENPQITEDDLDAAWRTGIRNDYSSCQVWGRTRNGYYLLGEMHGKWESPELRRRVAAFREEWAREYPSKTVALVVETAGGGMVAAQELREAYDFPVVDFEVKGSTKLARSEAVTPLAEGGKVWIPSAARAPWVRGWLGEMVGFPQLGHDDRCDAASMALQRLRSYVEPYCAVVVPRRVDLDRVPF